MMKRAIRHEDAHDEHPDVVTKVFLWLADHNKIPGLLVGDRVRGEF